SGRWGGRSAPAGGRGSAPEPGASGPPGSLANLAWSVVIRGSCSDALENGQHLEGRIDLDRDRALMPVTVVVPPFARGQAHGPRAGTALDHRGDDEVLAEHELIGDLLHARLVVGHGAQDGFSAPGGLLGQLQQTADV